MNRLVVTFKYTSRCENLYCVAIVAHRWLLVIGLCLRIQNQHTHYQCSLNIQWSSLISKSGFARENLLIEQYCY